MEEIKEKMCCRYMYSIHIPHIKSMLSSFSLKCVTSLVQELFFFFLDYQNIMVLLPPNHLPSSLQCYFCSHSHQKVGSIFLTINPALPFDLSYPVENRETDIFQPQAALQFLVLSETCPVTIKYVYTSLMDEKRAL